jgi:hypothetical protein
LGRRGAKLAVKSVLSLSDTATAAAVDFVSSGPIHRSPDLVERAWKLPVAKLYSPLLSQGFTSICGPTSVANVLRSMGIQSGKNPLRGFGVRPMSLDQLASEAAEVVPSGWWVRAVRPRTVDELRAELRTSNDPNRRYIANFTRVPLFGRGGGHHSPLGGFLEAEDLAFVLDVNAAYGPWLVSTEALFGAIDTMANWSTQQTRGLVRFEREPEA